MKLSAEYLKTLQNRLDIVSNNVANTSTPGFKEQLISVEEGYDAQERSNTVAFYGGMPASQNPVQNVNQYAGKRLDLSQGPLVESGNPFDMAILGEGFFQVRTLEGQPGFTRSGMFSADGAGNLVNNNGMLLEPKIVLPANAEEISIDSAGNIRGIVRDPEKKDAEQEIVTFGKIPLFTFANPDGLEQAGNNVFLQTEASGKPAEGVAGKSGYGIIKSSMLEKSNTNLLRAMTNMIQIQRSYQIDMRITQSQDEMMVQTVSMRG